jgi:hypothetical protein
MSRKNLVIVSLVAVVTFGLLTAYEWINHTQLRQADTTMTLAVGSCLGTVHDVSPACAVSASASGCQTKYEKKQVSISLGGGQYGFEYQDDPTKPLGCEPSPVDYHGRCYNAATTVPSKTVESSYYSIDFKNGSSKNCINTRHVYICVEKLVNPLILVGRKHCVGEEDGEETCPSTYPTVEEGC